MIDKREYSDMTRMHWSWHEAMNSFKRVALAVPRAHGATTQLMNRVMWEYEAGMKACLVVHDRHVERRRCAIGNKRLVFSIYDCPPTRLDVVLIDDPTYIRTFDNHQMTKRVNHIQAWIDAALRTVLMYNPGKHQQDTTYIDELTADWFHAEYTMTPEFDSNVVYRKLPNEAQDFRAGPQWPEKWTEEKLAQLRIDIGGERFDRAFLVKQ
jgi:hypothetical protein